MESSLGQYKDNSIIKVRCHRIIAQMLQLLPHFETRYMMHDIFMLAPLIHFSNTQTMQNYCMLLS